MLLEILMIFLICFWDTPLKAKRRGIRHFSIQQDKCVQPSSEYSLIQEKDYTIILSQLDLLHVRAINTP